MQINDSGIQTIILAAGMGTRLRGISGDLPKSLVPVAGKPLLDHALAFASQLAPEQQPIVVGGYRFDLIEKHCSSATNIPYRLVNNPAYELGSIHSLLAALPLITRGFFLINADHIFPRSAATQFRDALTPEISIYCDQFRKLCADDMKVEVDEANQYRVQRMSKTLSSYQFGYIGVTFVPTTELEHYRAASGEVVREHGDLASVEKVIQVLADRGNLVAVKLLDGILWYEVDTPSDFEIAAQHVRV